MKTIVKRAIWVVVALGIVATVVLAFRPQPVPVDTVAIARGALHVTVDDDGMTRVRERYTITAPIQGRLVRTLLDPGDPVVKGETVVAEFAPIVPHLLDTRSRNEARARLSRADAAVKEATARHKQAAADVTYFGNELRRMEKLVEQEMRSTVALERARRDQERAEEGLRAAAFAIDMTRFGRDLAKASVRETNRLPEDVEHRESTRSTHARRIFRLRSPVSGRVLRVLEESARTLAPGTPILSLGDVGKLEIVADYLSQDAVQVQPGMQVEIAGWGGQETAVLHGKVRIVEPSGFTKISALGVEEQRVNILVDPDGDPKEWSPLGDGFRVELRIRIHHADDVVLVPTGALFRKDGSWAVFAVEDEHATLKKIRIGRRTGLQAQVQEGLMAGDAIIIYPSDAVREGTSITPRPSSGR